MARVRYLTGISLDDLKQNVRNLSQISLCLSRNSHWAHSK